MDTGKNPENRPSIKSGDYLWDCSGEPDPEIQRLESLLGKFRHDSPRSELCPSSDGHCFPGACDYFPLWQQQRLP